MKLNAKPIAVSMFATLTMFGCGGTQPGPSSNSSTNSTITSDTATPPAATPSITPNPSPTTSSEQPIEFTYLGVTPDKKNIRYKIKVNSSKLISQVDLGVKYTDDKGTVIDDTTFVWQNIVRSRRLPIEKGKTYDVEDYLPEGATKADVVLKRVVFDDGTYWRPN